jgi:hypothetical protein
MLMNHEHPMLDVEREWKHHKPELADLSGRAV